MAYPGQAASSESLADTGHWDLNAHLCIDSLGGGAGQRFGSCWVSAARGRRCWPWGWAERLHGFTQGGAGLAQLLGPSPKLAAAWWIPPPW